MYTWLQQCTVYAVRDMGALRDIGTYTGTDLHNRDMGTYTGTDLHNRDTGTYTGTDLT